MKSPFPPLPTTKCRRRTCKLPFAEHVGDKCPNGRGTFVRCYGQQRTKSRASTSLSPDEVQALDSVLRVLQRGGDARALVAHLAEPLERLARKAAHMKSRVAAAKPSARPGADTSSPTDPGRAEAVGGAT
jgi:hypothetical protein